MLLKWIANRVFNPSSLARIIYRTFDIDYFLKHRPDYGIVKPINLDDEGAESMRQELELVFNKPGWFKTVYPTSEPSKLSQSRRKYFQLW